MSVEDAISLIRSGRLDEASKLLNSILSDNPENAAAHHFLGLTLHGLGRGEEGSRHFELAIAKEPENATYLANTALTYLDFGRTAEAVELLRRAALVDPGSGGVWGALGYGLMVLGQLNDAVSALEKAIKLGDPDPRTRANLLGCLVRQGESDKAVRIAEEHLTRTPSDFILRQAAIWPALYSDYLDADALTMWISPIGRLLPRDRSTVLFRNNRNVDRKLRVGMISPDFRRSAVFSFLAPLVDHIDAEEIGFTLFSTTAFRDEETAWLESKVDGFHDISRINDRELAKLFETLKIDVVIDLVGHGQNNRVTAVASRLAPVQLSWLGFAATTGVPAMDGWLVDDVTNPAGTEKFATERLIRMPAFLCYRPLHSPKLARETETITIGSFNNVAKVNETTLRMWVACLNEVPRSQLILQSPSLSDPETKELVVDRLNFWGVPPHRYQLIGHLPSAEEHMRLYNRLDVAMDPYPYNGTTTTCDALWMGVPVVTLAGEAHHSRVSASILTKVGHPEWIAADEEGFVEIVKGLAKERTAKEREELRQDMLNSPLMNEHEFAENWASAVRGVWSEWASRK